MDRAVIERLIASLTRLLDSTVGLGGPPAGPGGPGLEFCSSRALGATWALDGLWRSLGLDGLLSRLLAGTRRDARTERVLFALVAARAILGEWLGGSGGGWQDSGGVWPGIKLIEGTAAADGARPGRPGSRAAAQGRDWAGRGRGRRCRCRALARNRRSS